MSTNAARSFRIGEVAERVGITSRTIRYYEELGLLGLPSERSRGAHRLYTEADVTRLTELVRLRDLLGLSLEALAALADTGQARAALRDRWADTTTHTQRVAILDEALPLVERQLKLVRAQQQKLDELAAELTGKLSFIRREQRKLNRQKPRADAGN